MRKRFVILDSDERATLQAGRHHHPQHQFRARCQALLLSADGHPVSALMQVLVQTLWRKIKSSGCAQKPI